MTDYTALADRCAEAGIGTKHPDKDRYNSSTAWTTPDQRRRMCKTFADQFCHDGRVVLAAMEKCSSVEVYWDDVGWVCSVAIGFGEHRKTGSSPDGYAELSKPIAILTACLDALEGRDD